MKFTIPAFCIATLFALAPVGAAQTPRTTGPRVPVEVVRQERPAPLVVRPATCFESIKDQATGNCLHASSTPTLGLLFPYPGINNVFVPPAFVGGGENNDSTGLWSTIGGGANNKAIGAGATIAGGGSNTVPGSSATVGGGSLNTASGRDATVGGGLVNTASGDYAAVGGGFLNEAAGYFATVAGGQYNAASEDSATVGGGFRNQASAYSATVGGGHYNHAYGVAATVAGGLGNTATGRLATVGGGGGTYNGNKAIGDWATVPGGYWNIAQGADSFAAGRRAKANHDGAFVWGDGIDVDKRSSAAHEFNVYASGGVRMFTNGAATTGAALAPGSGTWSMLSDRDSKENVEPVDPRAVLESVVAMPLSTWNYKEQDDSVRHMGPMAQDFHAAFGLGVSDKLIDSVDPDGVALAAIQGLNAKLEEAEEQLEETQQRLEQKDAEIAELTARLDRLEALAMAR